MIPKVTQALSGEKDSVSLRFPLSSMIQESDGFLSSFSNSLVTFDHLFNKVRKESKNAINL